MRDFAAAQDRRGASGATTSCCTPRWMVPVRRGGRAVSESRLPGSATALFAPPTHPRLMPGVDWTVRKQATRVRKRINRFQSRRSD